jgi:hypothetical protein
MRLLAAALGAALFLSGLASPAFAQETEPNDTCATSRDTTAGSRGVDVEASLDARPGSSLTDVDFFRFTAPPGTPLRVGADAFLPLLVGVFDERCERIAVGVLGPIDFSVPESGVFNVGVADGNDAELDGRGTGNPGFYFLFIRPQPRFAGSISGRIVDGDTGVPLPDARVELDLCLDGDCSSLTGARTDELGHFRFELLFAGRRLPVGTYRIFASTDGYRPKVFEPFDVAEDERRELGDLGLDRNPVEIVEFTPCALRVPQSTTCEYSVEVRNPTRRPVSGVALSFVSTGTSLFEASTLRTGDDDVKRARIELAPGASRRLTFSFDVPSFVRPAAFFCTDLQIGLGPTALFAPVLDEGLFCVQKTVSGLRVLDAEESRRERNELRGSEQ